MLAENLFWQICARPAKIISDNNKCPTIWRHRCWTSSLFVTLMLRYSTPVAMLCYFKRTNTPTTLLATVSFLTGKDVEKVNGGVKRSIEEGGTRKRVKYNDYSLTERACIGQYTAENWPARAVRYFSKVRDKKVPEKKRVIITFRWNKPLK